MHGVNLSLGYPFDPSWFATGLSRWLRLKWIDSSPTVCVVVAAGNTGYGAALGYGAVARCGSASA